MLQVIIYSSLVHIKENLNISNKVVKKVYFFVLGEIRNKNSCLVFSVNNYD